MKVLFVIIAVIFIIAVVLYKKLEIEYEIRAENFSINTKVDISIYGRKLFQNKNKQVSEVAETEKKKKRMPDIEEIQAIKNVAVEAVPALYKLIKKVVKLDLLETDIKVALPDPMENGIAYGIISGGVNILYAGIMKIYPKKKFFLDIEHDFKSGEGVILYNKAKLYVRPISVLFWIGVVLISRAKLRKALTEIKKLSDREEKNR